MNAEVIITLTTIDTRIAGVHLTIESLLRQQCTFPYQVRLHVSHEPYLLDRGIPNVTPEIESLLHHDTRFKVIWVKNTGPYRKLVPVLADAIDRGIDPMIVTCDDDVLYPPEFLETLINTHLSTNSIVAYRGYTMQYEKGSWLPYKVWQKSPKEALSIRNIATGKDGILYRASHFDARVLHQDSFIEAAPTADDIWFKWHTALRSVPVYLLSAEGAQELPSNQGFDAEHSLYTRFNRSGGNDAVVSAMESLFERLYGGSLLNSLLRDSRSELAPRNALTSSISASLRLGDRSAARRLLHLQEVPRNRALRMAGENLDFALQRSSTRRMLYQALSRRFQAPESPLPEKHAQVGGFAYTKRIVSEHDFHFGWLSQAEFSSGGPRVSIVMTTFNSARTVEWSVRSALDQDYAAREVVVVDDNSDDQTWEILQRLEAENHLLRVFRVPKNRGTYFCKNVGLLAATGDYLTFQDSDDYSHPARIRLQLWHLMKSGSIAVRCNYVRHHATTGAIVPVNGGVEKPGFITLMLGRTALDQIGFFDCARKAADDELICRIRAYFGERAITELDLPLYVALYEEGSLIDDSTKYDPAVGLTFRLSGPRDEYLRSFTAVHKEFVAPDGPAPARLFAFPPTAALISKPKELRAFEEQELCTLANEVGQALTAGRPQSTLRN